MELKVSMPFLIEHKREINRYKKLFIEKGVDKKDVENFETLISNTRQFELMMSGRLKS